MQPTQHLAIASFEIPTGDALQNPKASGRPALHRADRNCGQGIGISLDERAAKPTDELVFLFGQLSTHWEN